MGEIQRIDSQFAELLDLLNAVEELEVLLRVLPQHIASDKQDRFAVAVGSIMQKNRAR